jgi:hypothetical protein
VLNYQFLPILHTVLAVEDNRQQIISYPRVDIFHFVKHRLPGKVRSRLEFLFGCDLAKVRIYEGDLRTPVPCQAITYGDSIYLQKGCYNPTRSSGLEILAHEITHVLQQRAGRLPVQAKTGPALIIDPSLEAEAELIGQLAALPEKERPFSREDILPDRIMMESGESRIQAFQPVVYIKNQEKKYGVLWKEVSEHFAFKTKPWQRYDKKLGKSVKGPLTDLQKKQAAKKLKFWCDAPMAAKISLMALTGRAKGRAKFYDSMLELIMDLVGQVFVDEGIARQTEDKLAELIYNHNERVSTLLTEAVRRVHDNFHAGMMKDNAHYKEVVSKKDRHYAWYYSSLLSKGGYLIGKAFSKKENAPMHTFEANKLRSVESAFQHFMQAKQRMPSWTIVAFLCDYAKLAKEVYPDYFTSLDKNWWKSEAQWFADAVVKSRLADLKAEAKKQAMTEHKKYYDGILSLDEVVEMNLEHLKHKLSEEMYQKFEVDIKNEAKLFKNFNENYDHLFYRLPQMGARSDKSVSQFNVKHPWVKKASEHQVPLGNGPSASTTFLLAMLQIIYPHEDTILAAALAIFEFWNRHYIQIQSDIHTWHEVMIAASPYVYNFDFKAWKKVDRKRNLKDPDEWEFEYPEIRVLQEWLTGKEKKEVITRSQVVEWEKNIAMQKQKNRSFKVKHGDSLPEFLNKK